MISLRGVKLRNLQNVDVDFPVGKITVVCGPSGSGKSTLVMDILHGESRRRYLETLSPFAVKVLGGRTSIPLDYAEGLRPSLALTASRGSASPKSSPLSLSECDAPLRILWAAFASPACPVCQKPMPSFSREEIILEVCKYPAGSRLQFLADIDAKDLALGTLAPGLLAQGYSRILADGKSLSLGDLTAAEAQTVPKEIFVVLDRIVLREGIRTRIAEAVDASLRFTHTRVTVDDGNGRRIFSTIPYCAEHRQSSPKLNPGDFSPHSVRYRCPTCEGNGEVETDGGSAECPECKGLRLKPEILSSAFRGVSWREILTASFETLAKILPQIFSDVPEHLKSTADILFSRVRAVNKMGLGYIGASRLGDTLSGGELGRLRLSPLATGHLDGICICLDEPASGLFRTDVEKLWNVLEEIRARGNTLVLIEHNPFLIERADYVIEMGPGAGELGGKILFRGTPSELFASDTPTGKWLRDLKEPASKPPKRFPKSECISVQGFKLFDMKPVSASFPVGRFSVITGESGSGKSTLLLRHILPRFEQGDFAKLGIENVLMPSSRSVFRNRHSSVASLIGIASPLRELFAKLPESKIRGLSQSKFSTSIPGGRCETCKGEGVLTDPSGYEESECPVCQGRRFRDEILDIRFKTLSFADVLDLTVDRALQIFGFSPQFSGRLRPLIQTGLGYLRLGQSTAQLSGGEASRLKLSQTLSKAKFPNTLFLFDEPARGLHKIDIELMLKLIRGLCENGHTVIAIEHQEDFIRSADFVCELSRDHSRSKI